MFNLAAPFLIDFFTDKMKDVLPYADYVVGNETEATAFGKKFFETVCIILIMQKHLGFHFHQIY